MHLTRIRKLFFSLRSNIDFPPNLGKISFRNGLLSVHFGIYGKICLFQFSMTSFCHAQSL